MHPSQERAQQVVAEGFSLLSDTLVAAYDIEEVEALDIVRSLPNLTDRLQDGQVRGLFEEAQHSVRRNRANVTDLPNPREYYPGHPEFMPPITSKHTFNAHMAQAMTPYVTAIARKIAHDRKLEAPDERTIQAVLTKTDWARAAYEARKMPAKPPPGRVRQFFSKYIFRPLDKLTDKIPFSQVFGMIGAAQLLMMLWATFGEHLEKIGDKQLAPLDVLHKYKAKQARRKISKIIGVKR